MAERQRKALRVLAIAALNGIAAGLIAAALDVPRPAGLGCLVFACTLIADVVSA